MKNKFLFVALIGILLGAGIVFVSCDGGCISDGKCGWSGEGVSFEYKWCADKVGTDTKKIEKAVDCHKDLMKQYTDDPEGDATCGC